MLWHNWHSDVNFKEFSVTVISYCVNLSFYIAPDCKHSWIVLVINFAR